jgi:hypothetical protein
VPSHECLSVPGPYPADVIQPHLAGINSDGRGFTGARTDDLGVGLPPGRRVKLKKLPSLLPPATRIQELALP